MPTAQRPVLCCAMVVIAALICVAPGSARADAIEGGQVYGVFATDGSFSDTVDPTERYTVVRLLDFGGGSYPESITPVSWPSTRAGFDPTREGTQVVRGSEFFLIGSIQGVPDVEIDHLLLSVSGAGQGTPEGEFNRIENPLHDDLILGTQQLGQTVAMGAAQTIDASAFWSAYGPNGESIRDQFFDLDLLASPEAQGAVVSLEEGSYQFEGGSEDLFGYNPDGSGTCDWFCDYLLEFEKKPWWPDDFSLFDWFGCTHDNEYFTGAINGGILAPTSFTDPSGNTTNNPVPEPASLALLGASLLLGAGLRRRRRRAA